MVEYEFTLTNTKHFDIDLFKKKKRGKNKIQKTKTNKDNK